MRARVAAAAVSVPLVGLACNAILGIDDDVKRPGTVVVVPSDAVSPTPGLTLSVGDGGITVLQGGSFDVPIEVARAGPADTTAVSLRVDGPSDRDLRLASLAPDGGVGPSARASDGIVVPSGRSTLRIAAATFAERGTATTTFTATQGGLLARANAQVAIEGHVDKAFGSGGVRVVGGGCVPLPMGAAVAVDGPSVGGAMTDGAVAAIACGEDLELCDLNDGGVESVDLAAADMELNRVEARAVGMAPGGSFIVAGRVIRGTGSMDGGAVRVGATPGAHYLPLHVAQGVTNVGLRFVFAGTGLDGGGALATLMAGGATAVPLAPPNLVPRAQLRDGTGLFVVGGAKNNAIIARMQAIATSPSPDGTFGKGGSAPLGEGDAHAVAMAADGSLVVGGVGERGRPTVWRVTTAATLTATVQIAQEDGVVRSVLPLTGGMALVGGYLGKANASSDAGLPDLDGFVARLKQDGSIDPSFAPPSGLLRLREGDRRFDVRHLLPIDATRALAVAAQVTEGPNDPTGVALLRLDRLER